jgi:opacity protein-like surface antigen
MNIKSMLLGTAAGLLVASAASAADLPGEVVPAAVDYVKVCDTFGAGFFYIPGTETCLDISGRVRFRVSAWVYDDDSDDEDEDDTEFEFRADGRVDFDARTMTEYGQLRSFFRIAADGGEDSYGERDAFVDAAFIQLGYLTVGYAGDLFNGDVLYGVEGFGYFVGDQDRLQITVLADDLGGGFYVGGSITTQEDGTLRTGFDDVDDQLMLQAAVGIGGQPWGSFDLSFAYAPTDEALYDDAWAIKATAEIAATDALKARLTAAYGTDFDNDELITLGAAVAYTATDALTVYAGVRYDILDEDGPGDDEDAFALQAGVDYTVTDGLILTGEVNYVDAGDGDDEFFKGIVQLTRNW